MKKKKYKLKKYNILIIVLVLVIIFCLFNITKWLIDNYKIKEQLEFIEKNTTVEVIPDDEDTEIISSDNIDEFDPYWDYINMDLISVDFDELKNVNEHTAGWVQVSGTNVNYPFVQAYTNEHYLWKDFYNQDNNAGWIFVDYRNSMNNFNDNTIIYGHSRVDETMFGSLKNILDNGWYDNEDNHIIKLSTEYENTLWQIFSVYTLPETSDYLEINFDSDEKFINYINLVSNRSVLDFNTSANTNDKLLTLSTCYKSNDDRLVIHAKLIKRDKK